MWSALSPDTDPAKSAIRPFCPRMYFFLKIIFLLNNPGKRVNLIKISQIESKLVRPKGEREGYQPYL